MGHSLGGTNPVAPMFAASAQVGLIWHLQVQLLCQVLQFQVCPFPPLTLAI
jgi:hypothetical protein